MHTHTTMLISSEGSDDLNYLHHIWVTYSASTSLNGQATFIIHSNIAITTIILLTALLDIINAAFTV